MRANNDRFRLVKGINHAIGELQVRLDKSWRREGQPLYRLIISEFSGRGQMDAYTRLGQADILKGSW